MSEKKENKDSGKKSINLTQKDMIMLAFLQADQADRFAVRMRKGDSYPLGSDWEVGTLVYRVVAVYSNGAIELQRVNK